MNNEIELRDGLNEDICTSLKKIRKYIYENELYFKSKYSNAKYHKDKYGQRYYTLKNNNAEVIIQSINDLMLFSVNDGSNEYSGYYTNKKINVNVEKLSTEIMITINETLKSFYNEIIDNMLNFLDNPAVDKDLLKKLFTVYSKKKLINLIENGEKFEPTNTDLENILIGTQIKLTDDIYYRRHQSPFNKVIIEHQFTIIMDNNDFVSIHIRIDKYTDKIINSTISQIPMYAMVVVDVDDDEITVDTTQHYVKITNESLINNALKKLLLIF